MPAKKIVDDTIYYIETVKDRYEFSLKRIPELQTEISDIQHILELNSHDAVALVKLAKELKNVLQERRRLKCESERLKPLYELFCKYDKLDSELKRVQRDVDRIIEVQENRRFSPRIRADLEPSLLKKKNDLKKLKLVMEQRNAS